jgi:sulfatase modifying factor 1
MKNLVVLIIIMFCCLNFPPVFAQEVNSIGMKLVTIKEGSFLMGGAGYGENYDESPTHVVKISKSFKMGATEVTNAQYELFDPGHKNLRGKQGFSKEDDEAVIFINYDEAIAFCKWLSKKEGSSYRLPTEGEWEYACRAGTYTAFSMGDEFPKSYQKNQKTTWTPVPVSLKVAQNPANPWGLYDMHGNVEEWCGDWYGPYVASNETDPVGRESGLFKVTRGGSHSTPDRYLRSANRLAMIPSDKSLMVGFRVVQGDMPATKALRPERLPAVMQQVKQDLYKWKIKKQAVFMDPIYYVHKPECNSGVPDFAHEHCPAITFCPNGDLLAVWFYTNDEAGREMVILGSRLRAGHSDWDAPSIFFKVPDRNMTGSSLYFDRKQTLYYMNGVEAAGSWENLAMVLRTSRDNGQNWSKPQMADPEHKKGNQVIAGMLQTKEGFLIQPADATPWGEGGTKIHISKDQGKTWILASSDTSTPKFEEGETGSLVAGIHAGVVQLKNGNLMALGRGNAIEGKGNAGLRMPMSLSTDMGKTWTYHASEFPPIAGGQRLILYRLNEGAILLVSFTNHPSEKDSSRIGMDFDDAKGNKFRGYGMFAAVSFDEGKTWPFKKLITDGKQRFLVGGAWTGAFKMDASHAEPRGYLAVTQTPDNIIHLVSSAIHYRFNLDWLKEAGEPVKRKDIIRKADE